MTLITLITLNPQTFCESQELLLSGLLPLAQEAAVIVALQGVLGYRVLGTAPTL